MTLLEAYEEFKKEKKRIEYFKKECDACVEDRLIEALGIIDNYIDKSLKLAEWIEECDEKLIKWSKKIK